MYVGISSILAVGHLPFINGGRIDQMVDIDVLRQNISPIDQSDQLINGAQQHSHVNFSIVKNTTSSFASIQWLPNSNLMLL
jgi:hypothetical protein